MTVLRLSALARSLRFLSFSVLLSSSSCFASVAASASVSGSVSPSRVSQPVTVSLRGVPFSVFCDVLMKSLDRRYVLSQSVLAENRPVSVDLAGDASDLLSSSAAVLYDLGFRYRVSHGIYIVSSVPPSVTIPEPFALAFYTPRFKSSKVIASSVGSLFPDSHVSSGTAPQSSQGLSSGSGGGSSGTTSLSTVSSTDVSSDVVGFYGPRRLIGSFRAACASLDVPSDEVVVQAYVFEESAQADSPSAFQTVMQVLNSKISLSWDQFSSMATVKNEAVQAVINTLLSDTRFRVVTSPVLRARSGGSASFIVGSQVPTLGGVAYVSGGISSNAVQSVVYRSAGVALSILPVVRDGRVYLDLEQTISSFVSTQNGVNSSPTLQERSVRSAVTLSDGDSVLLGGLSQDTNQKARSSLSFLPFVGGDHNQRGGSDLVLVLRVHVIRSGTQTYASMAGAASSPTALVPGSSFASSVPGGDRAPKAIRSAPGTLRSVLEGAAR